MSRKYSKSPQVSSQPQGPTSYSKWAPTKAWTLDIDALVASEPGALIALVLDLAEDVRIREQALSECEAECRELREELERYRSAERERTRRRTTVQW